MLWLLYLALVACVDCVLPGKVTVKSRTQSVSFLYYVVLANDTIYLKPTNETTSWSPLATPKKLGTPELISADGNDLLVVNTEMEVYFYRFSDEDGAFLKAGWQGGFGVPRDHLKIHPSLSNTGVSISQRGLENHFYTDIAGFNHYSKIGCDSIFAFNASVIHFVDGWILPDISFFQVCSPMRGRFIIEGADVSASTQFVISSLGQMWTGMADFDILGYDPLLKYTFDARDGRDNGTIVLPPKGWTVQPGIPPAMGSITSHVTILQNGVGNDARELRVQGKNSKGQGGYFTKPITGSVWSFVETGEHVTGPFLDNTNKAVLAPSKDATYPSVPLGRAAGLVALEEWQPFCSPAQLVIRTVTNQKYVATLHHRFQWPTSGDEMLADVLLPQNLVNSTEPEELLIMAEVFRGKNLFAGSLHRSSGSVRLVAPDVDLSWEFEM